MPLAYPARTAPFLRHAPAALLVGVYLSIPSSSAWAQDRDREPCFDAYEQAQRIRLENRLRESRKNLLICVRDVCPSVLRADCLRWLDEVEASLPTVVFVAADQKRGDVQVFVDGQRVAERLDGVAVALDPGSRALRFVDSLGRVAETTVTIREGERNRQIVVDFDDKPDTESRPIPPTAYVFGTVGLLGVAGFSIFGLRGLSGKGDLDACKGQCASDEVDAVRRDFVIADVSLAIGFVAFGAAAYIWLSDDPTSAGEAQGERAWVSVAPTATGTMAVVGASF